MNKVLTPEQATDLLWRSGNLSWKLHAGQLEIYHQLKELINNGCQEFAFRIARQYGKSYLIVILALELCLQRQGVIVRILGPTLDSISKIVDDNLQPIIADAPQGLIVRLKSDKRYKVGKSSLRIGTLERAHVDKTARGGNAWAIFLDECAASVKSEDLKYAVESVITAQLAISSKKRGGGILGYLTTPAVEGPSHYFHSVIEPQLQASGAYWERDVYQNPQMTPESIALAMRRSGGEFSEAWQREYMVKLFRSTDVAIVPEFNPALHVREICFPAHKKLYTCIDFGGSRDHHHAVLYYWDFLANKLCIYSEVHAVNQTPTVKLIEKFREMESCDEFGPVGRYADLPGQLSVDLNQTHMFECTQTVKDDADTALQNLRDMFAMDMISIHPRCVHTIKALAEGQWNNQRTDFVRSPELGHCDGIDCLVYVVRNLDKSDPFPAANKRVPKNKNVDGFIKLAQLWK